MWLGRFGEILVMVRRLCGWIELVRELWKERWRGSAVYIRLGFVGFSFFFRKIEIIGG